MFKVHRRGVSDAGKLEDLAEKSSWSEQAAFCGEESPSSGDNTELHVCRFAPQSLLNSDIYPVSWPHATASHLACFQFLTLIKWLVLPLR